MNHRPLLVSALALGFAGSALGWVQEAPPDNPTWPIGTNLTMQLRLGASPVLSDGRTWNVNMIEAMQMWSTVLSGNMRFSWVPDAGGVAASGNGTNDVFFGPDVYGSSFGANTLAITTFWYSGHTMTEADIVFNNTKTWDAYRGALKYPPGGGYVYPEFRRVALHELGHALGLGHPDEAGQSVAALMDSTISNFESLCDDDIEGAVALYGIPTPVHCDFNGDGMSDIFWLNGGLAVWLMNGTAYSGTLFLDSAYDGWAPVTTADFNADGSPDIVWESTWGRHVIWYMNGGAYRNSFELGTLPIQWHLASSGDFDGDRMSDLVWENTATGERYLWLMGRPTSGNRVFYSSSVFLGVVPVQWRIAGGGDFNADGKIDLVWENTATGERYLWLMDGVAFSSSVYLGTVSTNWRIAGTGEFNSHGNTDILWENTGTGERGLWMMSGTRFSSWVSLGTIETLWRIGN